MARILAIDWDGVEVRFALGTAQKDRLIVQRRRCVDSDAAERSQTL